MFAPHAAKYLPLVIASVGCEKATLNEFRFPLSAAARSEFLPAGKYELLWKASFGSPQGPGALDRLGFAAAVNGDTLAVADLGTCSVALYSSVTTGFIKRIGSCGEGSGEFRTITALSFSGADLVVYDDIVASGLILSPAGESRHFAIREPGRRNFNSVVIRGNEFIAAGSYVTRSKSASPPLFYVLVGDLESGAILSRFLQPPAIARSTKTPLLNTIAWCTPPDTSKPIFVAGNQWHPEIAVWVGNLSASPLVASAPSPFGKPRLFVLAGERLPRFKRVRAGCGREAAIVSFEEVIGKGDNARIAFTYVAMEYSGEAHVLPVAAGPEGQVPGHVIAATGNTFFFTDSYGRNGLVNAFELKTTVKRGPNAGLDD